MTVEELKNVLLTEIEADGHADFVTALITDARAAIRAGRGAIVGALTSSSVNGKSFTRGQDFSPVQVLQAARAALEAWTETDQHVSATCGDFRSLNY